VLAHGITALLPRLALRGLMDAAAARTVSEPQHGFASLAALRARLAAIGIPLDTLSMGMSVDFEVAIRRGRELRSNWYPRFFGAPRSRASYGHANMA